MNGKNIYHILGVSYEADQSSIDMAYRQLALLYHPDRNHSQEAAALMAEINQAYEILGNLERRRKYDREHLFQRSSPVKPSSPAQNPIKPIINQQNWQPRSETPAPQLFSALVVRLHYHPYAIGLETIHTVLASKSLRWIEDKPHWIDGVIEHNSRFYPAADLRDLLDLTLPEEAGAEPYLLCSIQGVEIALRVDQAQKTIQIPHSEIKAVPRVDEEMTFSFLNGLYLEDDQVILCLNLDGLLTPRQLEELHEFQHALRPA